MLTRKHVWRIFIIQCYHRERSISSLISCGKEIKYAWCYLFLFVFTYLIKDICEQNMILYLIYVIKIWVRINTSYKRDISVLSKNKLLFSHKVTIWKVKKIFLKWFIAIFFVWIQLILSLSPHQILYQRKYVVIYD